MGVINQGRIGRLRVEARRGRGRRLRKRRGGKHGPRPRHNRKRVDRRAPLHPRVAATKSRGALVLRRRALRIDIVKLGNIRQGQGGGGSPGRSGGARRAGGRLWRIVHDGIGDGGEQEGVSGGYSLGAQDALCHTEGERVDRALAGGGAQGPQDEPAVRLGVNGNARAACGGVIGVKEGLAARVEADGGDTVVPPEVGAQIEGLALGVVGMPLATDGELARAWYEGIGEGGAALRARAGLGGAVVVDEGWEQGCGVVVVAEAVDDAGERLGVIEGEDVVAEGRGVEGKVGDLCDVVVEILGYEEAGAVEVVACDAADVDVAGDDVGGGGDLLAHGEADGDVGGAEGGDD